MRLSPLRRLVLAASAAAIAFTLPLTLFGCGGGDSAATTTPAKNFAETHKDSMSEFQKNKAAQKGGHH